MKTRIALCATAIVAGLVASSASAMAYKAYATTDLKVRSGPGTEYRSIGVIGDGERVNVSFCEDYWCRLAGGGWVSAKYLQRMRRSQAYDTDAQIIIELGTGHRRHHHHHIRPPHHVKPIDVQKPKKVKRCKGVAYGQPCQPWK